MSMKLSTKESFASSNGPGASRMSSPCVLDPSGKRIMLLLLPLLLLWLPVAAAAMAEARCRRCGRRDEAALMDGTAMSEVDVTASDAAATGPEMSLVVKVTLMEVLTESVFALEVLSWATPVTAAELGEVDTEEKFEAETGEFDTHGVMVDGSPAAAAAAAAAAELAVQRSGHEASSYCSGSSGLTR